MTFFLKLESCITISICPQLVLIRNTAFLLRIEITAPIPISRFLLVCDDFYAQRCALKGKKRSGNDSGTHHIGCATC